MWISKRKERERERESKVDDREEQSKNKRTASDRKQSRGRSERYNSLMQNVSSSSVAEQVRNAEGKHRFVCRERGGFRYLGRRRVVRRCVCGWILTEDGSLLWGGLRGDRFREMARSTQHLWSQEIAPVESQRPSSRLMVATSQTDCLLRCITAS
jgi:hypothetical protein